MRPRLGEVSLFWYFADLRFLKFREYMVKLGVFNFIYARFEAGIVQCSKCQNVNIICQNAKTLISKLEILPMRRRLTWDWDSHLTNNEGYFWTEGLSVFNLSTYQYMHWDILAAWMFLATPAPCWTPEVSGAKQECTLTLTYIHYDTHTQPH